ncbi:MAG: type II toxin-antitoxin system RelE/ParE family toxin [Candidatus Marinimicrobia bacterium]|nr:type II toxin-antitoxin system RelE/ParE family toxin [Candidatus Neomarinimicrobiota bacterium]MBL7009807.1 type II toxin-antitoxin system RelE/ParE family toxin [Candidatus Neomarinimicrobiota bacterium]MBL7029789.1 type II toxin-antitoxin system RelE/ParE family toxin [Candidatus Neomarinimicrobiota bacterium]
MVFTLRIEKRVVKQLLKIDGVNRKRIKRKISSLSLLPRPHGVKKLSGRDAIYRIRQGNYRVIYCIDDKNQIIKILKVDDRKDVYK